MFSSSCLQAITQIVLPGGWFPLPSWLTNSKGRSSAVFEVEGEAGTAELEAKRAKKVSVKESMFVGGSGRGYCLIVLGAKEAIWGMQVVLFWRERVAIPRPIYLLPRNHA